MNIDTRECDLCGTRYRGDRPAFRGSRTVIRTHSGIPIKVVPRLDVALIRFTSRDAPVDLCADCQMKQLAEWIDTYPGVLDLVNCVTNAAALGSRERAERLAWATTIRRAVAEDDAMDDAALVQSLLAIAERLEEVE